MVVINQVTFRVLGLFFFFKDHLKLYAEVLPLNSLSIFWTESLSADLESLSCKFKKVVFWAGDSSADHAQQTKCAKWPRKKHSWCWCPCTHTTCNSDELIPAMHFFWVCLQKGLQNMVTFLWLGCQVLQMYLLPCYSEPRALFHYSPLFSWARLSSTCSKWHTVHV